VPRIALEIDTSELGRVKRKGIIRCRADLLVHVTVKSTPIRRNCPVGAVYDRPFFGEIGKKHAVIDRAI
jgi:hypothetical protein